MLQDTTKIERDLPDLHIPPIKDSIVHVFERMKVALIAAGKFPPPPAKAPRAAPAVTAAAPAAAGSTGSC